MVLSDGKGYEKGVCWAILQIWKLRCRCFLVVFTNKVLVFSWNHEVHPNLESSRKYGTANWGHEEGKPIAKPNTATVAELQDQILFYLNEYLVHETKGRILHRRFCEDFEGWTRPIWSKVSTPLRTKLRNELDNRGVVFSNEFEEESDEASEDRDDIEDPSSADLNDVMRNRTIYR
ncbi:hypothetical protein E4U51_006590 [Claviceps purpurea]|nr:hypothetical protein E4U51_006590 [Claviceps purpurea]